MSPLTVKTQIIDGISKGALLLEDGASLPESLVIGTERHSPGWSSILGSSGQFARDIEGSGWTFFYMANQIHRRGFGFDDQSRTDRAVARVIAAVKGESCNCLEVTEVTRGSFLGLPFTSVTAHARQIQKSRSFHDAPAKPFQERPLRS